MIWAVLPNRAHSTVEYYTVHGFQCKNECKLANSTNEAPNILLFEDLGGSKRKFPSFCEIDPKIKSNLGHDIGVLCENFKCPKGYSK